jgi:hypothetical protein
MADSRIGKYEVSGMLGRGGMATVYLAHDPDLDREVAIKVLNGAMNDTAFRERFTREARIIGRLRHDAIVPVHHMGEDNGLLYLVIEQMHGGSLADRIEGRPMRPTQAIAVLRRIASGLDAAHQAGVVHRDVKPANVLFDSEDRAFISDFGIARVSDGVSTTTHTVIGTPTYMSPEQCQGLPVGPATDIYSLGAMAFEMLTGQAPFSGSNVTSLLHAHVYQDPPAVTSLQANLPGSVDTVVARALAKDPAARYPTATSFISALADALRRAGPGGPGDGGASSADITPPAPRPGSQPSAMIGEPPTTPQRPAPQPFVTPASRQPAPAPAAAPRPIAQPPIPVGAETEPAPFCLNCGNLLRPGAQFCAKCGTHRGVVPTHARLIRFTLGAREAAWVVGFILGIVAALTPWASSLKPFDEFAQYRIADWIGDASPIDGIIVLAVSVVGLILAGGRVLTGRWAYAAQQGTATLGALLVFMAIVEGTYIASEASASDLAIGFYLLAGGAALVSLARFLPMHRRQDRE